MTQLRRRQESFINAGVRIVLVGLGDPSASESFRNDYKLDFPIISDPQCQLYAAYGLYRTNLVKMTSPTLFIKGVKAFFNGHTMGIPTGDVKQLAGVFIIDRNGIIRFSHRAENPADHPSPDELLAAIQQLN